MTTDILQAVFKCNLNKLKRLLPDRIRVNQEIPGTEGCTPLHLVVGIENIPGKEAILSYLLEIGANPNARSHDELTPVHIAAMWNNCFELEKLLQNGGNPWLTDNENKNSFDLAINNYAYDTYQLLHRYLAEDKLNFRSSSSKSSTKSLDCKEHVSYHETFHGDFANSTFYSANENFPVFFSSTDDESGNFLQNVSRILKKHLLKNENLDQEFSQMNLTKNINYDIPKDEKQPIFFNNAEANYSSNLNNVTQDRTLNDAAIFSSSEMEFYSSNEREKEIVKVKNPEVVIDTDNESGIMLIEKKFLPLNYSRNDESSYCDCVADDWKACKSQSSCCSLWSNCSSHTNTLILITDDYKKLSNSEIYDKLTAIGDDPGPISETTRDVYLRRLIRLNTGCDTSCNLPIPKYSQEVYTFLDGRINLERVRNLIHLMADEFNSLDKKWREGNQRCCFNYFLLDPRVTRNLPLRQKQLTYENTFLTFLDALFYVGKGTRGRPYNHLIEAAKAINNDQLKNDKISHILDIWGDGYGVVSLHCFNNCIPVEAYTQEACIIEAIGLKNLTNIKNGDYYGAASKWKKSWKRQVGTELLQRALQIFILEGEKQIMPKDIKIR